MMECMEVEQKNEATTTECSKLHSKKSYYKETFRFIDEALKLEDKGKKSEAVLCYRRSLRSITNGRSVSLERSEVGDVEFKQYETINEKLAKAQQEVLQRLAKLSETAPVDNAESHKATMDEMQSESPSLENEAVSSEQSGAVLKQALPSAPPSIESHPSVDDGGSRTWHDTKELINIQEGVRLFHVKGTEVSTWTSHCSLQVFQILKEKVAGEISPPAFLKCGEWLFPMEPAQSPVLKSGPRTYMFPDMANNGEQVNDASSLPCVGIVLADFIADTVVNRFERVLSLYTDFRKEALPAAPKKEKPERPPPPMTKSKDKGGQTKPSASSASEGIGDKYTSRVVTRNEVETIVAEPGVVQEEPQDILASYDSTWSQAITKGIHIGSQWISWGFVKGSEYASVLVEKGSTSLQKRMKSNPEALSVSPEVSRNLRQLHETTGSVVQISSFLASTLGALVTNLGKNLAPLVIHQGHKLLPEKYKVENNEKTQQVIDDAKKVAVAGLQGFSLVFLALEQSGKNLYQSVSKATKETMQHKYGDEVGEVTGDAMGAAGNTAQALWNVRKLGPKAIAKNTAKETGKAMLEFEKKDNPHTGNNDGMT